MEKNKDKMIIKTQEEEIKCKYDNKSTRGL